MHKTLDVIDCCATIKPCTETPAHGYRPEGGQEIQMKVPFSTSTKKLQFADYAIAKTGETPTNGFKTLYLASAQPRKGDQRRDVCAVDFGTVRAVST